MRACGAALEPPLLCVVVGLAMAACLESKPGGTGVVLDLGDGFQQGPSSASEVAEKACREFTERDTNGNCVCIEMLPYEHNGVCVAQCPSGMAPKGNGTCAQCDFQTPYSDHKAHVCVATCPPGAVPDASQRCTACANATLSDALRGECVSVCPINLPFRTELECAAKCPPGESPFWPVNSLNSSLNSSTAHNSSLTIHNSSSSEEENNSLLSDVECRPCSESLDILAQYSYNNTCVAVCPAGLVPTAQMECAEHNCHGEAKYWDLSQKQCLTQCAAGAAPDRDRICRVCGNATRYADHMIGACVVQCADGSVPNSVNDCVACEAGTLSDPSTNTCVEECPPGLISNYGTPSCVNATASESDQDWRGASEHPQVRLLAESAECPDDKPYTLPEEQTCVADCGAGAAPKGGSKADRNECLVCRGQTPYFIKVPPWMAPACVSECPDGFTLQNQTLHCEPLPTIPSARVQTEAESIDEALQSLGEAREEMDCTNPTPYFGRANNASNVTAPGCVDRCPPGEAPDSSNNCVACSGDTPYANKLIEGYHKCTDRCPAASTPDEHNDCQSCSAPTPYADHHTGHCVSTCGQGEGPDPVKDCGPCGTETPFSDHNVNRCVNDCPPGHAPDVHKDCMKCDDPKPYADHIAHECVENCPQDYKVGDNDDCVPDVLSRSY